MTDFRAVGGQITGTWLSVSERERNKKQAEFDAAKKAAAELAARMAELAKELEPEPEEPEPKDP